MDSLRLRKRRAMYAAPATPDRVASLAPRVLRHLERHGPCYINRLRAGVRICRATLDVVLSGLAASGAVSLERETVRRRRGRRAVVVRLMTDGGAA